MLTMVTFASVAIAQEGVTSPDASTVSLLNDLSNAAEALGISSAEVAEHPVGQALLDKFWWDSTGKSLMNALLSGLLWGFGTMILLVSYRNHFHRKFHSSSPNNGEDHRQQSYDTVIEVKDNSRDLIMFWHMALWFILTAVCCAWIWATL